MELYKNVIGGAIRSYTASCLQSLTLFTQNNNNHARSLKEVLEKILGKIYLQKWNTWTLIPTFIQNYLDFCLITLHFNNEND